MPQLRHDAAAGGVYGIGHLLPACHLRVGPQARHVLVAHAVFGDGHALGNQQAGGGALGVVLGHDCVGDMHGLGGAQPGQRRHDDAVRQRQVTNLQGIEQGGHKHIRHGYKACKLQVTQA
ncbi:hypothetical protein D3C87_1506040 [compost metagenome]